MKLTEIIRKLFGKKNPETVTDILNRMDSREHIETIGNRTFARLWLVKDIDNNFKTVKDGFKTKADAKAYCETVSFNWYLMPYEIEI